MALDGQYDIANQIIRYRYFLNQRSTVTRIERSMDYRTPDHILLVSVENIPATVRMATPSVCIPKAPTSRTPWDFQEVRDGFDQGEIETVAAMLGLIRMSIDQRLLENPPPEEPALSPRNLTCGLSAFQQAILAGQRATPRQISQHYWDNYVYNYPSTPVLGLSNDTKKKRFAGFFGNWGLKK